MGKKDRKGQKWTKRANMGKNRQNEKMGKMGKTMIILKTKNT